VLERVNAKKVFPVHVEHADLFARFMRDLKGKVMRIEKGQEYLI
jgi:hypothetical protein